MTAPEFLSQTIGLRETLAALAMTAWLGLCWACLPARGKTAHNIISPCTDWLILHASQSGSARRIAGQLEACLSNQNVRVSLIALNELHPVSLSDYTQVLLVVSTYGDGEPPDNGAAFWRKARQLKPDLHGVNYALLALGDRQYEQFCAFGRQLTQWLAASGARSLLSRQEVNQLDSEALGQWQQQLSLVTGHWIHLQDDFRRWRLLQRQWLNPDSSGAPAWLIRFQPLDGQPAWRAGDLVQLRVGTVLRSYSIANLLEDGVLELIVRQVTRPDGALGHGSGWLCCHAQPGSEVQMQVLANPSFHLSDSPRPCILVGAGTGLAGLRGLLREHLQQSSHPAWLIFGERCPQHDRWLDDELATLVKAGRLMLDRCFSRPPEQGEYVQQRLTARAEQLRRWVGEGASVHVCGSRAGMGAAVHRTLQTLLTAGQWQDLQQHGRYRRDLY